MLPEGIEMVMPGDNVSMEVELITPIAMDEGLRFAIREGGRTVGAGVVAEDHRVSASGIGREPDVRPWTTRTSASASKAYDHRVLDSRHAEIVEHGQADRRAGARPDPAADPDRAVHA